MSPHEQSSKLHIDTDWKAEAQAEKEQLAREEAKSDTDRGEPKDQGELPKADFRGLVGSLASQAIMGLGAMGDPKTGRVMVDLQGAKFAIDLLGVVEDKTKGNLDDDEVKELTQILTELRGRFVQISNLLAQQAVTAAQTPAAEGKGAPPDVIQP